VPVVRGLFLDVFPNPLHPSSLFNGIITGGAESSGGLAGWFMVVILFGILGRC